MEVSNMAVQWTDEQLKAITERGSNILVAAAAGSGKTAVLVERIIRRICDDENRVSIDKLLVLTFTEAAAAEMKRKIANAIEKRLVAEPDNVWLREQSMLVHSAHISTIHAFCMNMLQNNIHKTNLPADFTLIDEIENNVLRNQALDKVLERYYQRIDKKKAFADLAMGYGGTKSDDTLRTMVLKLYDFVRSLAYPEKWLKEAVNQYKLVVKNNSIKDTIWEKIVISLCNELALEAQDGLKRIWEIVDNEVPSDHKYFSYYRELYDSFNIAFMPILQRNADINIAKRCCDMFVVSTTPRKTGLDEETVEKINLIKKQLVLEPVNDIKSFINSTDADRLERVVLCSPRVNILKKLVRQTERLHTFMKRDMSTLDFGDLEHEMIKLISDKSGRPTVVAEQLRERFEEILVDEYQDTNNIQDTMFKLLSRNENNIFMVGDLKQSIYKFRNADPSIFAEKYERYSNGDGGKCIRLFKNFRSRTDVIDSVNGIFSAIMKKETGGLDYTKDEYLICGADYQTGVGDFCTEILLTDGDKNNYVDDEYTVFSSNRQEAITIAKRISEMVGNKEFMVKDSATEELRPVRLGDITILVRNKSRVAELQQVLAEYGIKSSSEVGEKYLDSIEVLTVLSFLQIIDNPRQDIPLLAVLRSPVFDFTPDELAQIRLCCKGDFYDAICLSSKKDNAKAKEFLDILNKFRDMAVYKGVDELIWEICYGLHYIDIVGSMPDGNSKIANLKLLHERGTEFEQGALSGLFSFMGYIESIRNGNSDMKSANLFMDSENIVSIMTIHKSKGLEFPVVILCNMDKNFNETDASDSVLWHENIGIGMDFVDTKLRVKYPSITKQLIKEVKIKDSRAEEMRLLYVALTRAKEKLIMSTLIGTHFDAWKKAAPVSGENIPAGIIRNQRNMRDWVLSTVISHPSAEVLRDYAECQINNSDNYSYKLKVVMDNGEEGNKGIFIESDTNGEDSNTQQHLASYIDRVKYEYPHIKLGRTPIKMSVSELKRRNMPDDEYAPSVVNLNSTILTENNEYGSAERGTITHYVMQHIDYKRTDSTEDIEEQLNKLVLCGVISNRQKGIVSSEEIFTFFNDSLGQRLKKSTNVMREFDFYMEVPAETIDKLLDDADKSETVLLQGIADCFFYEDDGVVLIDYKTDFVTEENVYSRAEKYREQVEYYTAGLESVLECPIKERYLYFLHIGKAVKM